MIEDEKFCCLEFKYSFDDWIEFPKIANTFALYAAKSTTTKSLEINYIVNIRNKDLDCECGFSYSDCDNEWNNCPMCGEDLPNLYEEEKFEFSSYEDACTHEGETNNENFNAEAGYFVVLLGYKAYSLLCENEDAKNLILQYNHLAIQEKRRC
jgi:hypothetical protein